MSILRSQYCFLKSDADVILAEPSGARYAWHTLAGHALNLVLGQALNVGGIEAITCDDFSIDVRFSAERTGLENAIHRLTPASARDQFTPSPQLAETLKFSDGLPPETVAAILRARLVNLSRLEETLRRPREFVSQPSA
jgi:hypothetical protein